MSTKRLPEERGFVDPRTMPKGPNGRPLCRQCSTETPAKRTTFCSSACVDAWRSRTDPTYQRRKVFERDRGICALCGIDTNVIAQWRREAFRFVSQYSWPPEKRRVRVFSEPGFVYRAGTDADIVFTLPIVYREQWGWPGAPDGHGWLEVRRDLDAETRQQIIALLRATDPYVAGAAHRLTLWDMDHIVPVIEGGGACGLDNLRTLCIPCHRGQTKALAGRRARKKTRTPDRDAAMRATLVDLAERGAR